MSKPTTLYDKIWNDHLVHEANDGTCLIYIDRHLVHEVTSPQAFEGLRNTGRKVRAPEKTLAVVDHNIPTTDRSKPNPDPESIEQMRVMAENAREFGIEYYNEHDKRQGIVHVIGPEQGFTLPGTTIVCGDSHTSTHGAFGALAHGIGTSEVEHVLATQTLIQKKAKNMRAVVDGALPDGVTAKDIILAIIGEIGTAGGTGHVLEYAGPAIRALSMEQRMTVCNMSIEGGARAGLIAPDETTFQYIAGRQHAPKGRAWDAALERWRKLPSDDGAVYDKQITIDADRLEPMITYGTNPGMGIAITAPVPDPSDIADPLQRDSVEKALRYMGLEGGKPLLGRAVNVVFIGSCTNSRISDLRTAASLLKGRKVNPKVRVMVVPGSQEVKRQAEAEGLPEIFRTAGCEWREPGCSMCIAMNGDQLQPGEYSVSTSNRNFEGRQGKGGRTFLASPLTAAASAITGRVTDPRTLPGVEDLVTVGGGY